MTFKHLAAFAFAFAITIESACAVNVTLNLNPSSFPAPGTIVYPSFIIQANAYLDDLADQDLGSGTTLANTPTNTPNSSALGVGELRLVDGMLRGVTFKYGIRGNQNSGTLGGFTGYTYSKSGAQRVPGVPGTVFKQFAVNQGQPIGPVTLNAPSGTAATSNGTPLNPNDYILFNSFKWTTSTAFENVNSISRLGGAQIKEVTLDVVPAKEILKNSVSQVPGLGREMRLIFQPNIDGQTVPLVDFAAALEVQQFNWVQTVTHLPKGWTANIATTTWGTDGKPTNINIVQSNLGIGFDDHILQNTPGAEKTYVFQTDDWDQDGNRKQVWWRQEKNDNAKPYWNLNATGVSDETSATFSDIPKQPQWSLNLSDSEDYFGFETRLVGVKSDGTLRDLASEFPGNKLMWKWKSNTVHSGGTLVGGGIFGAHGSGAFPQATDTEIPTDESGGIFDIETDTAVALLGDYDLDGTVSGSDFSVWQRSLGTANLNADGDGSGVIDAADLEVWRTHFGETRIANQSVPEPRTDCIFAIFLTTLFTAGQCVKAKPLRRRYRPTAYDHAFSLTHQPTSICGGCKVG